MYYCVRHKNIYIDSTQWNSTCVRVEINYRDGPAIWSVRVTRFNPLFVIDVLHVGQGLII